MNPTLFLTYVSTLASVCGPLTLVLQNLNLQQMEELHEDIQRYLGLEELQVNIDFWTVS